MFISCAEGNVILPELQGHIESKEEGNKEVL